jgi:hypothetical protein
MKRQLIWVVLSLFLMTGAYSQIDTCAIDPYIQNNYLEDAYILVGRQLVNPLHPYHDSIDIPLRLLDRPLKAMSMVFNSNCPERDTVFDIFNLHARGAGMGMMGRMIIRVDTTYAWVQQLIADTVYSGNPAYDTLVASRGFKVVFVFIFTPGVYVVSPNLYNLPALIEKLVLIPGVISASPDGLIGDGGDIKFYQGSNSDSLVYNYGWGDCMAGCIYHRFWNFTADSNCTGTFHYAYGDPIQQAVSVNEIVETVMISPNPFTSIINIDIRAKLPLFLEVYSMNGALVVRKLLESDRVDLSCLREGPYMVRVSGSDGKTLARELVIKAAR